MTIRSRKFIGTIALLALVIVWGLVAMTLAQSVLMNINGFVAALYYVVAGLGWVLPAMPLIAWMSRPDALALLIRRLGRLMRPAGVLGRTRPGREGNRHLGRRLR